MTKDARARDHSSHRFRISRDPTRASEQASELLANDVLLHLAVEGMRSWLGLDQGEDRSLRHHEALSGRKERQTEPEAEQGSAPRLTLRLRAALSGIDRQAFSERMAEHRQEQQAEPQRTRKGHQRETETERGHDRAATCHIPRDCRPAS
ncbi:hypothetical protein [Rhodovulum sulfidophilum]|uniref:hypothetical protein n=1 Tax=Rhodovulum sulfidophilum TaxID=35806 RepID=UPI001F43C2DB|nr:hypothetical protein [Rhodovulum sulfidophilum]MCE8430214.1 hypothetical protein [Rhodovulum sulfidophilum]